MTIIIKLECVWRGGVSDRFILIHLLTNRSLIGAVCRVYITRIYMCIHRRGGAIRDRWIANIRIYWTYWYNFVVSLKASTKLYHQKCALTFDKSKLVQFIVCRWSLAIIKNLHTIIKNFIRIKTIFFVYFVLIKTGVKDIIQKFFWPINI